MVNPQYKSENKNGKSHNSEHKVNKNNISNKNFNVSNVKKPADFTLKENKTNNLKRKNLAIPGLNDPKKNNGKDAAIINKEHNFEPINNN